MEKTTIFRFDSKHRKNGTFSEFEFDMFPPGVKRVTLLSAMIPNTIFPISKARETNGLYIAQNDVDIYVLIKEGHYTCAGFCRELEYTLNNHTLGSNKSYIVRYNPDTQGVIIKNVRCDIKLCFESSGYIYHVMGFEHKDTEFGMKHSSTNIVNLNGPLYLWFDFDGLSHSNYTIDGPIGTFMVDITVPFGYIQYFMMDSRSIQSSYIGEKCRSEVSRDNTRNRVRIFDDFGLPVVMKLDWNMMFLCELE